MRRRGADIICGVKFCIHYDSLMRDKQFGPTGCTRVFYVKVTWLFTFIYIIVDTICIIISLLLCVYGYMYILSGIKCTIVLEVQFLWIERLWSRNGIWYLVDGGCKLRYIHVYFLDSRSCWFLYLNLWMSRCSWQYMYDVPCWQKSDWALLYLAI